MSHFPGKVDVNPKRRQNRILAKYKYGMIHHPQKPSTSSSSTANQSTSEITNQEPRSKVEEMKLNVGLDMREEVLTMRYVRMRKGHELFYSLSGTKYDPDEDLYDGDDEATTGTGHDLKHERLTGREGSSPPTSPTPFEGFDEDYVIRNIRPLILAEDVSSSDSEGEDSNQEDNNHGVTLDPDDMLHGVGDHGAGKSSSKSSKSSKRRNSVSSSQTTCQASKSSSKINQHKKRRTSGSSSTTKPEYQPEDHQVDGDAAHDVKADGKIDLTA